MKLKKKVETHTAAIGIAKILQLCMYTAVGGIAINARSPTCSTSSNGCGSSATLQDRPATKHHWLHLSRYLYQVGEIVSVVTVLQVVLSVRHEIYDTPWAHVCTGLLFTFLYLTHLLSNNKENYVKIIL